MTFDRKITAVRRDGLGRCVFTFLLVLAFALQSYLTQTHIHGVASAPVQPCAVNCVVHAPLNPVHDETTANCAFCQAIVQAGAFSTPTALTILVSQAWVQASLPVLKSALSAVVQKRDGLSRAPPR